MYQLDCMQYALACFIVECISYFSILEPNLKLKIRVLMKNASGLDEAGIDGGGIFREFLSELLKTGFDPNRGIFMLTASDDKMLYPNPQAPDVLENSEKHFFFLGRLLGKVCCHIYNLYNNIFLQFICT